MNGVISTKTLGIFDYIVGLVTASSPWLFGFAHVGGASLFLPLFIGCMVVLMSIFSNYEFGAIKIFPMQMHLSLEVFFGFFLFVSPFLYGFYHLVFLPQVILGLIMLLLGIFTKNSPFNDDGYATFDSRGM